MDQKIKYCPDLTSFEEHEGYMIGSGKIRQIVLNLCLKEKCAAYKQGYCKKYDNIIDGEEYKNSTVKGG